MHKDNEKYWIERHVELRNDIRSVGNLAKDVETNMRGFALKIERLRNAIFATLGSIENRAVLEVGCGIGMMAPDLIRIGARYTGIDISHLALAKAQERCPSGTFICHSAFEYKLDTRFALVFCTDVLVHLIKDENWRLTVQNMKAHLDKNGVILIKEEIWADRRTPSAHVVSRSNSEYLDLCASLNLSFGKIDSAPGFYCMVPLG
jgi:2-polyprenyl-3-methyl-5-hydroxy-6-metoxy-1,4-benzoquinol methylase